MGRVTDRRRIVHLGDGVAVERVDTLVAEEPLEMRVGGVQIAVTMRTPGDDFDLVAGFAWTEGIVADPGQLAALRYCAGADADGRNSYNVIDLALAEGAPPLTASVRRNFYTTSSCGVCGKASIDASAFVRRSICSPTRSTSRRLFSRRYPKSCVRPRNCSTAPAACMPPVSSPRTPNCWRCAKMSGGTTPSTKSSDGRCANGDCRCRPLS